MQKLVDKLFRYSKTNVDIKNRRKTGFSKSISLISTVSEW